VKEFGRPDCREHVTTDLNQSLLSTLVVCRSEYKYVADVVTDLAELPPILCHPGELNQVFLNLIVNASHAIADVVSGTDRRGKIVVRSRFDGQEAIVSIEDTGEGFRPRFSPDLRTIFHNEGGRTRHRLGYRLPGRSSRNTAAC